MRTQCVALIERREQSEMRARIKQFRIHRVFAHDFDRIAPRKIANDRLPCFSQIGRAQNRRTIVAHAISIRSDVRHIRIDMRRLDA